MKILGYEYKVIVTDAGDLSSKYGVDLSPLLPKETA